MSLLRKYKIDPGRRYILSVSTIEPRKNILGILNAFKILCSEHPEYRDVLLVLSGHMGWRNDSLKSYMATYPYRDNIVFAGYVALEDMPSFYSHAEAFIYLSFYEGFGIPILEAMKVFLPGRVFEHLLDARSDRRLRRPRVAECARRGRSRAGSDPRRPLPCRRAAVREPRPKPGFHVEQAVTSITWSRCMKGV